MKFTRGSGVLMHPTSFSGPHGIGDMGVESRRFVDWLVTAGQTLWQVLPLGPTGYGDSPYASFSTFAGQPLMISLDELVHLGDLHPNDLHNLPTFPLGKVDFGWVQYWKKPILNKAAENFLAKASPERKAQFEKFVKEESHWLEDFALFMAVKDHFQAIADKDNLMGKMWSNYWDSDIALKEPKAVKAWSEKLSAQILSIKVIQWYFYTQWLALKKYANDKGIQIIGDIPIFVAADSVDVWANKELFHLDKAGQPLLVAGVPPDYFSATGQLWGNPLYKWDAHKKQKFQWWIDRVQGVLKLVDILRIDHFRGFEAYWEIPAGKPTAIDGRWVKAPGMELFEAIKKALGRLPIIAEDLGVITPEVEEMRDHFEFPGMKILQFAFDSSEAGASGDNPFLPHNYVQNCIVYTGTHDNDTALGWYRSVPEGDQKLARDYVHAHEEDVVWGFVRACIASTARWSVVPMQDLLNVGADGRMNTPSTLSDKNWSWRILSGQVPEDLASRLHHITKLYGRAPVRK